MVYYDRELIKPCFWRVVCADRTHCSESYPVIICLNSHTKLTKSKKLGQVQVGLNIAQNHSSGP